MTTYQLKQHDTAPGPRAQLLDGDGDPVELTGATVKFKARRSLQQAASIDAAATVEDPVDNGGAFGWVHYDLAPTDTAQPGALYAEWEADWGGGNIATFPGGDVYDLLLITPDLDSAVGTPGTGYCTRNQARETGVTGDDATVDAYIAAAEARVDSYTQAHWRAEASTVVAPLSPRGVALLPRQVDPAQSVAVRAVGATTDLPATSYLVTSSRTLGQVDAVHFDLLGSDPIIAGAEPWNGGWANLLSRYGNDIQLAVTGTFGAVAAPLPVQLATALIAADIQASGTPGAVNPGPDTDDEGNTVVITSGANVPADAAARTTGVPAADHLLHPLRQRPVRLS